MDQISMGMVEKTDEEVIKEALIREINNLDYTKYLIVATNKDDTISVRAKTFLAVKAKLFGKTKFILFRTKNKEFFEEYIATHKANVTITDDQIAEASDTWSRLPVESLSDVIELAKPISEAYMTVLADLCGERFGCCSRYEQCSDAKKCVNPDLMMSLACAYKKNLEEGSIFYGKNKNA